MKADGWGKGDVTEVINKKRVKGDLSNRPEIAARQLLPPNGMILLIHNHPSSNLVWTETPIQ